jgi:C1A family cysteine protease
MDGPKKQLFQVYHVLFQKQYDLNSEEGLKRYSIFKQNLKQIKEVNSKNLTYKLDIGPFADLTSEEFKSKYLTLEQIPMEDKVSENEHTKFVKTEYNPIRVDYTNFLPPVKNQQGCGSCWAFTVITAIEANIKLIYNQDVRTSPQNLIDCDLNQGGCKGGKIPLALDFIKDNGIALEADYPYTSGFTLDRGNCLNTPKRSVINDYEWCTDNCNRDLIQSYLSRGIVSTVIDGEGNGIFQHYSEGVIDMPCKRSNHGVNMYGYDNQQRYYMLRNSWGEFWGEDGNFRLAYRDSDRSCFTESFVFLPKVNQVSNIIPPKPLGCLKVFPYCDGNGSPTEICNTAGKVNGQIKGFDIGKFNKVVFFDGENCVGSYYESKASVKCFNTENLLDRFEVKSIALLNNNRPKRGCVWFYVYPCHLGDVIEKCNSEYDISNLNVIGFKVGPGILALVTFSDINFTGVSFEFEYTFNISDYMPKISSFQIVQ